MYILDKIIGDVTIPEPPGITARRIALARQYYDQPRDMGMPSSPLCQAAYYAALAGQPFPFPPGTPLPPRDYREGNYIGDE